MKRAAAAAVLTVAFSLVLGYAWGYTKACNEMVDSFALQGVHFKGGRYETLGLKNAHPLGKGQ